MLLFRIIFFFSRLVSVFHLTVYHPRQPSQFVTVCFGMSPFFAWVGFFSFLFKFQLTDTSKVTTRKSVKVIIGCCALPLLKLNSETVLLIAPNCDTFSNKPDTSELACWHLISDCTVNISNKPGLSKYLGLLKEFVLLQLEESSRLCLHFWWVRCCSFG